MQQVLLNFGSNAVKFTAEGEVRHSRARRCVDNAARVALRFEVTDTGIGIAEDDRERLFSPFAQADTSTTRKFGGTGLGLTICRQLVELMGGAHRFHQRARGGVDLLVRGVLRPRRRATVRRPECRHRAPCPVSVPSSSTTTRPTARSFASSWPPGASTRSRPPQGYEAMHLAAEAASTSGAVRPRP